MPAPRGTALIQLENTLIRGVLSVSFSGIFVKVLQCIAAQSSFQFDMMSKVKVKLIDEHARLILWQTGSICVLNNRFQNTGFVPVVRLINTIVQFCSETLPDLAFSAVRYMLDLNTGFALVVRLMNIPVSLKTLPDGTFGSILINRAGRNTRFRFMNFIFLVLFHLLVFILISEVLFENHVCEKVSSIKIIIIMNTLVQFCGEHAASVSCRFCVLDTGFALA